MRSAYRVENLVKRYPRQTSAAVDGVTFDIQEGEIFGLLGDNGAGKTTLIRQLVGLLRPTSGKIELFGRDVVRYPSFVSMNVGYMPQGGAALNRLTVSEALYFSAHLRGMSRSDARRECRELLDLWQLGSVETRACAHLSGGQRRLLQLAVATSGHPPVLILDEPTNELDPLNKKHVWEVLRDWNVRFGTTIVLVTHDAVEAEKVIKRVGIVQRGSFIALGLPSELKAEIAMKLRVEVRFDPRESPLLACSVTPQQQAEGYCMFLLDRDDSAKVLSTIDIQSVTDIRVNPTTLEDLYIHYVS